VPTAGLRSGIAIVVRATKKGGAESEKALSLVDDGKGPVVSIVSPGAGIPYALIVEVQGQVSGPGDASDPLAELASLTWTAEGTGLGGPAQAAKDGSFDFAFSTLGLRGDFSVSVHAQDKNGHASSASVRLSDCLSGPSLLVQSPADKSMYSGSVAVEGRVGDPTDPSGTPAEVKSLSWRVIGRQSLTGKVAFEKDAVARVSPHAGDPGKGWPRVVRAGIRLNGPAPRGGRGFPAG
jgi:hypothetical protein